MADARGRGRARGRARGAPPAATGAPAPAPAAAPQQGGQGGRGRAGGRGRGAPPQQAQQVQQAAAPPQQVAQGAGGRPPVGRSTAKPQHGAGDLAARTAAMGLGGNGNNGNGNGSGNGSNGKPIGRGAVRPSRDGKVLYTKPENMGPKQGTSGQVEKMMSNYFELKTTNSQWSLCKHHVDIVSADDSTEDRTFIRKIILRQHQARFSGYLFDGSTLFTFQNACPDGKALELVSKDAKTEKEYKITIKFTGTVEKSDYQYMQIFNIIMRDCQHHLKLELIRRNYYDPAAKIDIPEHKLELWPGYVTSVMQCEHSTMLQAEISYKVLRRDTAYDVLQQCYNQGGNIQQSYNNAIIGTVVMTQYNNKTYRVDEVDYAANPESSFESTKRGVTSSKKYIDYFRERYNVRISDPGQPMLISRCSARDIRAGRGAADGMIYLVPELCVMTGLTDSMRQDFRLMKAVAAHTCVDPGSRMDRLKRFNARLTSIPEVCNKLKSWGLELSKELVQIPGRILPSEKIIVGDARSYDAGKEANWDRNLRSNKMWASTPINSWAIIFMSRSGREVREFFQTLQKVANGMKYTIQQPRTYELQSDRASEYVGALDRAINEVNPEMVMCVVPNNRADRYSAIKKKCIVDKPTPSQVILYKTITSKGVMSIATKVAIQMNCKVGGAPWGLEIPFNGLMTVGYDVCHDPSDKRRSYGAMVSTLDKQGSHWYSNVTRHSAGEELSTNFALNIKKAVGRWKQSNNDLPKAILVYRDGVGEGQIEHVKNQEINEILSALTPLYQETHKVPPVCFVIVTKRINTRIFMNRANPPPGAIVDDVITDPSRFDFFLISQSVRQGTVSPTHYNCIANTAGLTVMHVQRLTYKFTHMYYNWSGTVRVPAPCQYAHKLAFLTAQSVGTTHSNLDSLLYFL